ncbi:helix-turn-helix domain-containing protein [Gordonia terrae]
MLEQLLNIDDAAELVGYHPVTLRKKIREGALPAVRRGRRLFIHRNDLANLFTSTD